MPTEPSASRPPVVLFGALRSGTTMFRLILNCHEALANPGETDFLLDHIHPDPSHATGWRYDREALQDDRIFRECNLSCPDALDGTDLLRTLISSLQQKAPERRLVLVFHRNAPKIAALLPNVPILHLLRDPRDVARSSIGMGWAGNSYYGVRHWIETERSWDAAAVPTADTLTVRFEDLMKDIETELTRICEFLDLPYSEAMLRYPEVTTYDPPDPRIAQQWRRKATSREIARIETVARPMMEARGYPPEQPLRRIGITEAAWLTLEHRVVRWRFNIRRFGFWLFSGHHLARIFGLKTWETKLRKRQEAIVIRKLK